ncbi:MAG TPA: hypothetical protein VH583_17905 [Vicinamibacterales bacterium]|jgi:hypothetical protein
MSRVPKIVVTAVIGVAALAAGFASSAEASCVIPDANGGAVWQVKPSKGSQSAARPGLVSFDVDATIVGFWHVDFVAEGNTNGITDGTPIDSAYVQWHVDGTEIMNSSRDPRTSSFCLGVWKRSGLFTYTLKHVAMSWDGAGKPVGPATISETVTLSHDGNSYTGHFTITQYATDGTTILPPTPIVGKLLGKRIKP